MGEVVLFLTFGVGIIVGRITSPPMYNGPLPGSPIMLPPEEPKRRIGFL